MITNVQITYNHIIGTIVSWNPIDRKRPCFGREHSQAPGIHIRCIYISGIHSWRIIPLVSGEIITMVIVSVPKTWGCGTLPNDRTSWLINGGYWLLLTEILQVVTWYQVIHPVQQELPGRWWTIGLINPGSPANQTKCFVFRKIRRFPDPTNGQGLIDLDQKTKTSSGSIGIQKHLR